MRYLLSLAHHPPVVVNPDNSVLEAVTKMSSNRIGAVGVVDGERLVGMFTERDVMDRVVLHSLDPASTLMRQVMTTEIQFAGADDAPDEALRRMVELHIRHLPIVDDSRRILGMLSVRHLLQAQLEKTRGEADALEAYLSADGIGG